jgi:hypothetical protein
MKQKTHMTNVLAVVFLVIVGGLGILALIAFFG